MRALQRYWLWGLGLAVVLSLIFFAGPLLRGDDDAADYRTQPVDRGTVARTVSATGALEPVATVDVGSTVSGPILSVEVDFNDTVQAGQVLARIDPQTFQTRADQLSANLAQAQANLAVAQADWERYRTLGEAGFASEQLLSQKRAALQTAQASVAGARAQLQSAQVDLQRTIIRAPVDGIVVDRLVEPGQSVAASFQAPTLFLIAQDLAQLQALITIDEADIGEVREGQSVRFTVDAFPGQEFAASVAQVRQQGTDNQGVVSYTVVVRTENPGGRLLPGMTANAEILISERENVLRLPNGALRFRPGDPRVAARAEGLLEQSRGQQRAQGQAQTAPGQSQSGGGGGGRGADALIEQLGLSPEQAEQARAAFREAFQSAGERPGPEASPAERRAFGQRVRQAALRRLEPILTEEQRARLTALREQAAGAQPSRLSVVWVLRDGEPQPVTVRLGVADDAYTEVLEGLSEGDLVVTGGGPQATAQSGSLGGPPVRMRGF